MVKRSTGTPTDSWEMAKDTDMCGEACEVEDNTVCSWPGVKLPRSLDSHGYDALHRAREHRRCTPGVKASFSGPHRGYASCVPQPSPWDWPVHSPGARNWCQTTPARCRSWVMHSHFQMDASSGLPAQVNWGNHAAPHPSFLPVSSCQLSQSMALTIRPPAPPS